MATDKNNFDYDLLCIGSGPAGQRAAVQAAKLDKRVAIVEKSDLLGGYCVEVGTIPSKTFREAVRYECFRQERMVTQETTNKRPQANILLSKVNHVRDSESDVIYSQLCRNDIHIIRGSASFKDKHTVYIDADGRREVTAKYIFIGVGTKPTPPPGYEIDGKFILTSDDIPNLEEIPKSLVVVGSGVIGIEYASIFGALGTEVTLIDKQARPLEFLDSEIVDELIHQMRNYRVSFRCSENVCAVDIVNGQHQKTVTILESGKRIVSDKILFSIGRTGATDGLNLKAAGVEADDRGRLKVNKHFRTNIPNIFAGGDVIGFPSLAATSSEQGRLAACYAFDNDTGSMGKHFPIGIYSIPEISMVGATEQELTKKSVPYEVGLARYREISRGQILGDDSGFVKMLFHRESRELLGVHAIGTQATELIHLGQAVFALGGTLDYFLETVFNYPTLAECYKVAALNAENKLATHEKVSVRSKSKK